MEKYIIDYEFENREGETKRYEINLAKWEIEELGMKPEEFDENFNVLWDHFYERAKREFYEGEEYGDAIDCNLLKKIEEKIIGTSYFTCEICKEMHPRYMEGATPTTCCHCNPERPEEETPTHNEIV